MADAQPDFEPRIALAGGPVVKPVWAPSVRAIWYLVAEVDEGE